MGYSDRDRDRRDRSRDRRRDRSRSRDRKKRSRSRDRKDRDRERERSERERADRERRRREEESKRTTHEPEPAAETPEEQFERDKRTVFVYRIHPAVTPPMLEDFFNKAGKVRAVRLIEDKRTGKSKGMAYIEFFDPNSIIGALALQGVELHGHPIMVKGSDAQKNVEHPLQQAQKKENPANAPGTCRIYVGELHPKLNKDDLEAIFSEVGPVASVEMAKDSITGENPGYGYVNFKKGDDAKRSLAQLHGFEMLGRRIHIGLVSDATDGDDPTSFLARGKATLMAKLVSGNAPLSLPGIPTSATPPSQVGAPEPVTSSNCILLKNMFDPREETEKDFDQDIKEDVAEECQQFGTVVHTHVEKNSAGYVYMKFASEEAAQKARDMLNKRVFNKRTVTCDFIPPLDYQKMFGV